METKNMIGGIVSLAVVVICVAAIMMPVLDDAMETAGEEVTKTNTALGTYKLADTNDDITFTFTKTDGYWTIAIDDGDAESLESTANINLLFSDVIIVTKNTSGTTLSMSYNGIEGTNSNQKILVFENGTMTYSEVSSGTTTEVYTAEYSWLYYVDDAGTMVNHTGSEVCYVSSIEELTMAGSYTSGENDCYYSFHDGELATTYDGETSISYDMTLADGTTNIYEVENIVITIGDETFTPYRVLVPDEVTGNEASGAAYSLYAAIPVIVIAGIVIASIGMVVARRD